MLERIQSDVTDDELRVAKERIKGSISFMFEDSLKKADFYARRELYGMKMEELKDIIKNIDAVDLESIKKIAKTTFNKEPTLAVIGPFKNVEKFAKILQ